jgi:hypothetical protein
LTEIEFCLSGWGYDNRHGLFPFLGDSGLVHKKGQGVGSSVVDLDAEIAHRTLYIIFDRLSRMESHSSLHVSGRCLCGAVELEIDFPAFWAWHDHSAASRRANGAAYATYIGCWRKHARVAKGRRSIARFADVRTESTRSFCSRCGTPLLYERKRPPHMVNIPRALFTARIGREPRYHVAIEELQDWAYTGDRLVPLSGYPGVVWERPKSRRRRHEI